MKTIHGINNPKVTTYFIVYEDESTFAYGEVSPAQQMSTGQPYIFQTIDRKEWRNKLISDFNTDPDQNENSELETPPEL